MFGLTSFDPTSKQNDCNQCSSLKSGFSARADSIDASTIALALLSKKLRNHSVFSRVLFFLPTGTNSFTILLSNLEEGVHRVASDIHNSRFSAPGGGLNFQGDILSRGKPRAFGPLIGFWNDGEVFVSRFHGVSFIPSGSSVILPKTNFIHLKEFVSLAMVGRNFGSSFPIAVSIVSHCPLRSRRRVAVTPPDPSNKSRSICCMDKKNLAAVIALVSRKREASKYCWISFSFDWWSLKTPSISRCSIAVSISSFLIAM